MLAIQDLVFALPLGSLTGIGLVVSSQLIGFSMVRYTFIIISFSVKVFALVSSLLTFLLFL